MGKRRHGKRPHVMPGACTVKGTAFTTYEAAYGRMVQTPGAIRVYRGNCCGYYHITSWTIDEFAQITAQRIQEERDGQEEGAGEESEPAACARDAAVASLERFRQSRLTPSPTEVARRIQGLGGQGVG